MKLKASALSILLLFSLCSCTGGQQRLSGNDLKVYQMVTAKPVTCESEAECRKKWARAIEWIKLNSSTADREPYYIRKLTDSMVQTNGVHLEHPSEFIPGYQVIKYPLEKGGYEIDFSTICDSFECRPSGFWLHVSFTAYVQGTPAGIRCDMHSCKVKKSLLQ